MGWERVPDWAGKVVWAERRVEQPGKAARDLRALCPGRPGDDFPRSCYPPGLAATEQRAGPGGARTSPVRGNDLSFLPVFPAGSLDPVRAGQAQVHGVTSWNGPGPRSCRSRSGTGRRPRRPTARCPAGESSGACTSRPSLPARQKYVTRVSGAVLDVIVDIRAGLAWLRARKAVRLDDTSRRACIPRGGAGARLHRPERGGDGPLPVLDPVLARTQARRAPPRPGPRHRVAGGYRARAFAPVHPGDQPPGHDTRPDPAATGAAAPCFSGSHQARLAAYQRTVSSRPWRNGTRARTPSPAARRRPGNSAGRAPCR